MKAVTPEQLAKGAPFECECCELYTCFEKSKGIGYVCEPCFEHYFNGEGWNGNDDPGYASCRPIPAYTTTSGICLCICHDLCGGPIHRGHRCVCNGGKGFDG